MFFCCVCVSVSLYFFVLFCVLVKLLIASVSVRVCFMWYLSIVFVSKNSDIYCVVDFNLNFCFGPLWLLGFDVSSLFGVFCKLFFFFAFFFKKNVFLNVNSTYITLAAVCCSGIFKVKSSFLKRHFTVVINWQVFVLSFCRICYCLCFVLDSTKFLALSTSFIFNLIDVFVL